MADRVYEREVVDVAPARHPWTPARVIALALGVLFLVLGGVALLRTGGIGPSLSRPIVTVGPLAYTPLLAIIEVVFGLLLLAAGAFPVAADGVVFLGVLALAFGLLMVIEPSAFRQRLAGGQLHGWFYVITGALATLAGLLSSTMVRRRATSVVRTHEAPRSRAV